MMLPVDYSDEVALRRAFSWLSRIGAGPKFGSLPIGWYQIHQCHALDILAELPPIAAAGGHAKLRCRAGAIEAQTVPQRWVVVGSPASIYRAADQRSRENAEHGTVRR